MPKFDLFKGHNSKMVNAIWLDIKLDQDCMPINNLGKFDADSMKNIQIKGADKGQMYDIDKIKGHNSEPV